MKKYLISKLMVSVTAILLSVQVTKAMGHIMQQSIQVDSLSDYSGRYEASQNNITLQYEIEVTAGKLIATNLTSGQKLNLKRTANDDFMVEEMGVPITFIRDGAKKVSEIQMPDGTVWKKLAKPTTEAITPANYKEYLGKYQLNNNGTVVTVEIAAKYGKLWALLSTGDLSSPLSNTLNDSFTINATGDTLRFSRDAGKVTRLLLKEKNVFVKVK